MHILPQSPPLHKPTQGLVLQDQVFLAEGVVISHGHVNFSVMMGTWAGNEALKRS